MNSISDKDARRKPLGLRDMSSRNQRPQAATTDRPRPKGPRDMAQPRPAAASEPLTQQQAKEALAIADIVLPPGPSASRRKKVAIIEDVPQVRASARPLPTPPTAASTQHPLPALPHWAEARLVTNPPVFRSAPKSLELFNEAEDLRDINNRPTHRLMAHVFSLHHEQLGGTSLTEAHGEMVDILERFCNVERPILAEQQAQLRPCLDALIFSRAMANRISDTLDTHDDSTLSKGLGDVSDAVMQQLRGPQSRVVFPGGIVGADAAHAVLFELTRNADKLSLRVYNTGSGVEYHHKDPNSARRFQTYIEIIDIDFDAVEQGGLVNLLLDYVAETEQTFDERLAQFYGFVQSLGTLAGPTGQYSQAQSAPNCAWKVLGAFLKPHTDTLCRLQFKAYTQSRLLEEYMHDNGIRSIDDLFDWNAGSYDDGALIEAIVQEAEQRFTKTELKLRAAQGRLSDPAQDLELFLQSHRSMSEKSEA